MEYMFQIDLMHLSKFPTEVPYFKINTKKLYSISVMLSTTTSKRYLKQLAQTLAQDSQHFQKCCKKLDNYTAKYIFNQIAK